VPGTSKQAPKRKASAKKTPQKKRGAAPRKHKKRKYSDASRAVLLTFVLILLAAVISAGIITFREAIQNPPEAEITETTAEEIPAAAVLPEKPETAEPAPETSGKKTPPSEAPVPPAAKPEAAPSPAPAKPPVKTEPAAPRQPPAKTNAAQPAAPARQTPPANVKTPARETVPAAPPPRPSPSRKGTLVFVIDDAGNNLTELEPFLRFPGPLTIAVLPGLPHSAEAARRIRSAGKEVFLHQPMEALGGKYPGPEAIYSGMSDAEIRAVLLRNLNEIGPIAGMNNHQGSKITMDEQMMETILSFCREQGILFLDSRTTAETAAPEAAKRLGITIGERNIFIDNEQDRASMNRSIRNGLVLAEQQGSAVMIGHTWSPELALLLTELHSSFIEQGYSLGTASALTGGRQK
jgi:polysaccharide deacetylase 2 family uncharacterized protein YibQ